MAVTLLRRLAAAAPVPVFTAVGAGAIQAVQDLRLSPEVRLVPSPRHATVLLVAGGATGCPRPAGCAVRDQMPRPRGTVWWAGARASEVADKVPVGVTVAPDGDVVATLVRVHRELLTGERETEPTVLPGEPPAPWKGSGRTDRAARA